MALPRSKLHGLQALRALAALLVVLDHAGLNLVARGVLSPVWEPMLHRSGAAGVYLFFVISGFVMAYTSGDERGVISAGQFMLRRIWRIAPLYWLMTAIYAVRLSVSGALPSLSEVMQSLLFIPYLDERLTFQPILGPGWTLNFEMYFYAVFAASRLLPRRFALLAIFAIFSLSMLAGAAFGWNDGLSGPWLKFLTSPILIYFLLGIAIHGAQRMARLTTHPAQAFMLAAALTSAALAATIILAPNAVFDVLMLAIAPAIIATAVLCPPFKPGLFTRLGDASYSLYLTHGFVLGPAAWLYVRAGLTSAPAFIIAAMIACAITGLLCHRYIETPLQTALRPLFIRRLKPALV